MKVMQCGFGGFVYCEEEYMFYNIYIIQANIDNNNTTTPIIGVISPIIS